MAAFESVAAEKHAFKFDAIVLNGTTIEHGHLVTHDSTVGEVKGFDGTEADRFCGVHLGDAVTGNNSGIRNRAQIYAGGFVMRNLTVAGVANTNADYGDLVYAIDADSYTVTASGNKLVGKILPQDGRETGKAHVYIFPIVDGVNDSAAT